MKKMYSIMVIIFLLILSGCSDTISEKITKKLNDGYEIDKFELRYDANVEIFITTKDNYKYLEFEVTFYDKNKVISDIVTVKETDLTSRSTYKYFFDGDFNLIDILAGKVTSAEITKVNGKYVNDTYTHTRQRREDEKFKLDSEFIIMTGLAILTIGLIIIFVKINDKRFKK